ncbi:MAG TPA: SBBP repeat-containing protein [Bryobacteraceae bacterium]|jgi:uncharacterized protein (TIGR03437 family)|nr:SBBP repeat-containing protein [Bryobacteraceae bacterium]
MRFVLFFLATSAIAGEFTTSIGDTYPYTVSAITTDSAGNTYIVGSRQLGTTGPAIVSPYVSSIPQSDVFVTKLDPNGKLLFTDIFAGKGVDTGNAVALDPAGNIYIAGTTTSTDFPLSKALISQSNASGTGFIIKLTNDGSTILYSTYFGGSLGATSITALATDSNGNLYLTGSTNAADFPHTAGMPFGPFSTKTDGAIMASISAAGDKILYSGALVGTTSGILNSGFFSQITTTGAAIAVDPAGNAYIAGNSTLALPTTPGVLSPKGIGAFVAKVNSSGTGLSYLTYLGSEINENEMSPEATVGNVLYAIAVDASGNAYLAGATSDPKFPTTPGSFLPGFKIPPLGPGLPPVVYEGFLAKLKPDASGVVWATYLDRGNSQGNGTFIQSIAADPAGNVWATGITGTIVFPDPLGVSTGPEFVVGLNSTGSALTYQANDPMGTVAQSVALDPSGLVHVAGINGFVSAIAPGSEPAMKVSNFQNAAGGSVTARVSPSEVIAIFGPGIGPATPASATPSGGFYPTTLAGVQATINGRNMPLLYVSANQINAVVPMELAINTGATVRVSNGSTLSPDYPVRIVPSAPYAFAPVINQDGTINSTSNPAKSGSIVSFYATGWQDSFAPLADGQIATVAQDACLGSCQATVLNTQNPQNFAVLYGGAAPGFVAGVTQFNVKLGTVAIDVGEFGITLNVFGISSFTQTVWYQK